MSLPTTRNRTYLPSSPVRSADLNDIQDCIVNLASGELVLPPFGGVDTNIAYYAGYISSLSSTGQVNRIPVHGLEVGDRITAWSFHLYSAFVSGFTSTATLVRWRNGSSTVVATATAANPAALAWTWYAAPAFTYTVVDGDSFHVNLALGVPDHRINALKIQRIQP